MNDFVHKDTFDAGIDEIRQAINAGVARQEKAVAEQKAIAAEINGKFETLSAKIDGMQRAQDIFISKTSFLITIFAVIIGIIQIVAILTPLFSK